MLSLADKAQAIEPESSKPVAEVIEEAETEETKQIYKQQIIAEWLLKNRVNHMALYVLCVFLGAALVKFFEYLFR